MCKSCLIFILTGLDVEIQARFEIWQQKIQNTQNGFLAFNIWRSSRVLSSRFHLLHDRYKVRTLAGPVRIKIKTCFHITCYGTRCRFLHITYYVTQQHNCVCVEQERARPVLTVMTMFPVIFVFRCFC